MPSKAAIGEELKQARLRSKIRLEDIAAATRINQKFLSEIEEGITPSVPTTYLRAFLRAFAEQVSLDPGPILQEYFAEPPPPAVPAEPARKFEDMTTPGVPRLPSSDTPLPSKDSPARKQVKVLVVLSAVLIATLTLIVLWLHQQHEQGATQEVPFSDVVKETENLHRGSAAADSVVVRSAVKPQRPDSLILEVVATESVWVHIVIDSATTKEYLMAPKRKLQLRARREFLISAGNADSFVMTLNGARLGPVGKPKRPVKNVPVTWETWERSRPDRTKKDPG
jgi:cytoskeletal protein RodZ